MNSDKNESLSENNMRQIYVANISPEISLKSLYSLFSLAGGIEYLKMRNNTNKSNINNNNLNGENMSNIAAKIIYKDKNSCIRSKEIFDCIVIKGYKIKVFIESKIVNSLDIISQHSISKNNVKKLNSNFNLNESLVKPIINNPNESDKFNSFNTRKIIKIYEPNDKILKRVIDYVSKIISIYGSKIEGKIEREFKFDFMKFDNENYNYFKWKTISFAFGDTEYSWREDQFEINNTIYIPPKMTKIYQFKKKILNAPEIYNKKSNLIHIFKNGLSILNNTNIFQFLIFFMENIDCTMQFIKELLAYYNNLNDINQILTIIYFINDLIFNSMDEKNHKSWLLRKNLKASIPIIISSTNNIFM